MVARLQRPAARRAPRFVAPAPQYGTIRVVFVLHRN
jgi:hypothetical protein